MHTPVETLDLRDVELIVSLLAGFAEALKLGMDFIP
jgi:putative aminopeptidase FrvX